MNKNNSFIEYIKDGLKDTWSIFMREFGTIFRDSGVIIIFFFAGLLYPILYNSIFKNETIYKIPIATVDLSSSAQSREFIRNLSATPEVKIEYRCANMEEAKELFDSRKVHGILLIPGEYHKKLNNKEQATISLYSDMSSFLYYKNLALAVNHTILEMSHKIQVERYNASGIAGEQAQQIVKPIPYSAIGLYNPGSGFSSFFVSAMLMIIIHQTLFFGIGMLVGTAREESRHKSLIPAHLHGRGIYRVVIGKAASYFVIYSVLSAYTVGIIPKLFNLPHIGNIWTLYTLLVPFLLATIFFSMTISIFIKNREIGFIIFLFFSVILMFLSGFSWPRSNMPEFWRLFSYLFPSTHGVQGYLKINTMGAELHQVRFEYVGLWIQAGIYFITANFTMQYIVSREKKKAENRD